MDYGQLREILVNTEALYNLWQSTGLDEEAFIRANGKLIEQTEKARLQAEQTKARQKRFFERQRAQGRRHLTAMVSDRTYNLLCRERDRSINSGSPKNLGDVLDEILSVSEQKKADTSKKLTENLKILISTYQKQKAECVGLDDMEGRYFAAGQVSALRLVLELIEAQKTPDQAQGQYQPADQAQDPKPAIAEIPTLAQDQADKPDVIQIMAEHRAAGQTWPAIATALNEQGILAARGGAWKVPNCQTFFRRSKK